MGHAEPDIVYAGPSKNYSFDRPWSSYEEMLTTRALAPANTPGAILQRDVRPPLTQIEANPPRFGYGDITSRTPTIQDVVNIEDRYNRYDYSGRTSGYEGTQRPSLLGG